MTRRQRQISIIGAILLAGTPLTAWGHIGFAANDLYAGMLHPLLHFATLLPLLTFALWLSQQSKSELPSLATAFLLACIAGATLGWLIPKIPDLQTVLLLLAILTGILVAINRSPLLWVSIILATLIGLSEGVDNVAQVRENLTDPLLYIAGLLLTAGLLPMHITGLLHGREQLWIRMGIRIISSWIITASVLVLTLQWSGIPRD
jgi:hydrogenase/urease accessory protein HupE